MALGDNDEILHDEEGWREEAKAVITDVKDCVDYIDISNELKSSDSHIYLNLTTREKNKYTIELTSSGFRIVAKDHNRIDETLSSVKETQESDFYETPYSLLGVVSSGYRQSFGDNLVRKLSKVQQEEEAEERAQANSEAGNPSEN